MGRELLPILSCFLNQILLSVGRERVSNNLIPRIVVNSALSKSATLIVCGKGRVISPLSFLMSLQIHNGPGFLRELPSVFEVHTSGLVCGKLVFFFTWLDNN